MLSWLYDIFVTLVTFVMGLFGLDLKKRSVTFADDAKDAPKESVAASPDTIVSSTVTAATVSETVTETSAVTESA
jgi:hypothetical protein